MAVIRNCDTCDRQSYCKFKAGLIRICESWKPKGEINAEKKEA